MTAIHQFVPSFAARDAIGAHTLQLRRLLHDLGIDSEVYVYDSHPEVAGIAPGAYIKVALEQNVISSFNNGIVNNDGSVVNATPLANGSYEIIYWKAGMSEPAVGTMPFSNGFTSNTDLYGSLFSLYENTLSANTYMIEQVELDEDGLVNVVATEMPVDQILQDLSGAGMVETQD